MKKVLKFCVLTLVLLNAVAIFAPYFGVRSELNCSYYDINLSTGEIRRQNYYWFIKLTDKISETSISKALSGESVEQGEMRGWQRVLTLTHTSGYSPQYRYGGCLTELQVFELIVHGEALDSDEQKRFAEEVLIAWQQAARTVSIDEIYEEAFPKG